MVLFSKVTPGTALPGDNANGVPLIAMDGRSVGTFVPSAPGVQTSIEVWLEAS
jgi:hypothetical protein